MTHPLSMGLRVTLTSDQILSLAPDAASAKAGSQLATPAKWSGIGRDERALWGECQGSGKTPYRTQIDTGEPAFKCTCPSRKFPCKHGLGLYLLLSSQPGLFAEAAPPQWVSDWLDSRQQRQEKKAEKAVQTPAQAEASAAQARKREEKREQNVSRGLADLQTWLHDLAREGLAGVRERGPAFWDGMAARLVDAQAGGLAPRLRRAGALCFQANVPDWERRVADQLASLYLVSSAWQGLERLPEGLQRDLRALVGISMAKEDVLTEPPITDRWLILAQRSGEEERMRSRATWLYGAATGRWALLLQFAVGAQGFEQALPVGTQFDGELCFYPGALPLRALIRQQAPAMPIEDGIPAAGGVSALLDAYAAALASQPFLDSWPAVLPNVVPDIAARTLHASDGSVLPLDAGFRHPMHLAALSGGHPLTLAGEWDGHAFLPLSGWHKGRLLNFETEFLA
ncbi:SWIM zinc finger family protein [Massilia sp. IC2-476]|uniref:SWIM zinc finger family protein n=1 Tax=Massilia sp. IC2-476 TaxID=2887199 RepID=UPI001D0FA023|nr:SWIM zinc finger family protein [Massilia sp. IC2-476]